MFNYTIQHICVKTSADYRFELLTVFCKLDMASFIQLTYHHGHFTLKEILDTELLLMLLFTSNKHLLV